MVEKVKPEKKRGARSQEKKKPDVNRKMIGWAFAITGIVSLGMWMAGGGVRRSKVAGWGEALETNEIPQAIVTLERDSDITASLQRTVGGLAGEYAVWVYRLNSGEVYGINEDTQMPAASIMKVPIMAAVLKQVENGNLELEDGYVRMLEDMGKNSDNTAPVILTQAIGQEKVKESVLDLGMTASSFEENTTTAADVGRMWVKLYKGEYLREEYWQKMESWLTDSIYEDRIPAGLPVRDGVKVIHKVGTGAGVWADGGVIECKSVRVEECKFDPFVLVVLNKETKRDEALSAVPELVRKIWAYETNAPED